MMLIHGVGAVTPVGLSAPQTCAAIRARVSGITASSPQAPPAQALPAARIPARKAFRKSSEAWLARLAARAISECLGDYAGDTQRLALLISIPETFRNHPGVEDATGHKLVGRIVRLLHRRFSLRSRILQHGHATIAEALKIAETLLASAEVDGVLVGASDSMLSDTDRLDATGRCYAARNPFGAIAGEGAACVLLASNERPLPLPAIANILGFGCAHEDNHVLSERFSVGDGLRKAIGEALNQANLDEGRIGWRITDVNGERHRIWESSMFATRQYRAHREGLPVLHLPALCGDVGSASGVLAVVVAAVAMARNYAPARLAACELASEEGLRGVCLIAPAADHSRRNVATAQEGKAGITAQLLHLPHDIAWLRTRRTALARGRATLAELADHDERLEASMDLLRTFGERGMQAARVELQNGDAAQAFFLVIQHIQTGSRDALGELLRGLPPEQEHILLSGFGWVPPSFLKGLIRDYLVSPDPADRRVALAACAFHGVNPGETAISEALSETDPLLRQRALKTVATLGLRSLSPLIEDSIDSTDDVTALLAARAATLLGTRGAALDTLRRIGLSSSPQAPEALFLCLQAFSTDETHALLKQLAADQKFRLLVQGSGLSGDPYYIPWLIRQMADASLARLAGAAFALISGQDLVAMRLDRPAPDDFKPGPSDNPDDENVAMDPDDGLPWPDTAAIEQWWKIHGDRYPAGTRHLSGVPVTREMMLRLLKTGRQFERILAAQQLCLLAPGTPLFNTAAPAWRQRRWLSQME